MSIVYYLNHNMIFRVLALFMVMMMLISCMATPAKALSEVVGIALIASILSAFGIAVSSTGAVDALFYGLDSLMSQFSETVHGSSTWLREQFNARISLASWGVLKLGGALVDAIREFISWLRSDKYLSPATPISRSYYQYDVHGVELPVISADYVHYSDQFPGSPYIAFNPDPDSFQSVEIEIPSKLYYEYALFSVNSTSFGVYFESTYREAEAYYLNNEQSVYSADMLHRGDVVTLHYAINAVQERNATEYSFFAYIGDIVPDTLYSDTRYVSYGEVLPDPEIRSSWQINDDNIDLSYLGSIGSSPDVYFSPVIPSQLGVDLSDVPGISSAVDDELSYTFDNTGTAEVSGTIDLTSEFEPGSGGSGNVPPIVIPSRGWFGDIWHYVVKALQDSAAGIAFVLGLMREVIPPEILNLAWAACVLLIVFGIVNRFLK